MGATSSESGSYASKHSFNRLGEVEGPSAGLADSAPDEGGSRVAEPTGSPAQCSLHGGDDAAKMAQRMSGLNLAEMIDLL